MDLGFERGFIARYGADGRRLWLSKVGGLYSGIPWDVALDGTGNVLVTDDRITACDFIEVRNSTLFH